MRCLRHSAGLVHTPLVSKCRWSRDGEGTLRATYEELMRCAGRDQVRCGRRGAHPAGRPASASPGRAVSGGRGTELESHQDNLRAERPLAFHTRFLLIPLTRVAVVFFLNEKPSLRPAWGAWRSFRELGAGPRGADVAPGLAEPLREREEAGGAGARPDFGSRTCRTGRCASRAAHPPVCFLLTRRRCRVRRWDGDPVLPENCKGFSSFPRDRRRPSPGAGVHRPPSRRGLPGAGAPPRATRARAAPRGARATGQKDTGFWGQRRAQAPDHPGRLCGTLASSGHDRSASCWASPSRNVLRRRGHGSAGGRWGGGLRAALPGGRRGDLAARGRGLGSDQ